VVLESQQVAAMTHKTFWWLFPVTVNVGMWSGIWVYVAILAVARRIGLGQVRRRS
jgi:hypothetical protein